MDLVDRDIEQCHVGKKRDEFTDRKIPCLDLRGSVPENEDAADTPHKNHAG